MTDLQETANKLRQEIGGAKSYRHDFVLRKFGFGTALLGIGSLSAKLPGGIQIDFIPLLYLVPLVAIAFDSYILVEDYRIKRAGEFIRSKECGASDAETKWENFAHDHPNKGSTVAFFFVTMLYLIGAALVIGQTSTNTFFFISWIAVVIVLEILLLWFGFYLRKYLERNQDESSNTPANPDALPPSGD